MTQHHPAPNDLPEVLQLADGIWQLPLPFAGPLKFSFAYALRTNSGLLLIDSGSNTPEAWTSLISGLDATGHSLDDVIGVAVTHAHPDHYGLAERVRGESGAWIGLHPADRDLLVGSRLNRTRRVDALERWLEQIGTPAIEMHGLMADRRTLLRELCSGSPDRDLVGGRLPLDASDDIIAIHTPGHTPGHLVFVDRQRQVAFTGDHVLPRVSPNISRRPPSLDDPLTAYEASLHAMTGLEVGVVAPGHERHFLGLDGRVRELLEHHEDRLTEVEHAVSLGASSPWEVAQVVSWSRPFATLDPRGARSALGETCSHLTHLRTEGRIRMDTSRTERWLPI